MAETDTYGSGHGQAPLPSSQALYQPQAAWYGSRANAGNVGGALPEMGQLAPRPTDPQPRGQLHLNTSDAAAAQWAQPGAAQNGYHSYYGMQGGSYRGQYDLMPNASARPPDPDVQWASSGMRTPALPAGMMPRFLPSTGADAQAIRPPYTGWPGVAAAANSTAGNSQYMYHPQPYDPQQPGPVTMQQFTSTVAAAAARAAAAAVTRQIGFGGQRPPGMTGTTAATGGAAPATANAQTMMSAAHPTAAAAMCNNMQLSAQQWGGGGQMPHGNGTMPPGWMQGGLMMGGSTLPGGAAAMDPYRRPWEPVYSPASLASMQPYWRGASAQHAAPETDRLGGMAPGGPAQAARPANGGAPAMQDARQPENSNMPARGSPLTAYELNLVEGMFLYAHLVGAEGRSMLLMSLNAIATEYERRQMGKAMPRAANPADKRSWGDPAQFGGARAGATPYPDATGISTNPSQAGVGGSAKWEPGGPGPHHWGAADGDQMQQPPGWWGWRLPGDDVAQGASTLPHAGARGMTPGGMYESADRDEVGFARMMEGIQRSAVQPAGLMSEGGRGMGPDPREAPQWANNAAPGLWGPAMNDGSRPPQLCGPQLGMGLDGMQPTQQGGPGKAGLDPLQASRTPGDRYQPPHLGHYGHEQWQRQGLPYGSLPAAGAMPDQPGWPGQALSSGAGYPDTQAPDAFQPAKMSSIAAAAADGAMQPATDGSPALQRSTSGELRQATLPEWGPDNQPPWALQPQLIGNMAGGSGAAARGPDAQSGLTGAAMLTGSISGQQHGWMSSTGKRPGLSQGAPMTSHSMPEASDAAGKGASAGWPTYGSMGAPGPPAPMDISPATLPASRPLQLSSYAEPQSFPSDRKLSANPQTINFTSAPPERGDNPTWPWTRTGVDAHKVETAASPKLTNEKDAAVSTGFESNAFLNLLDAGNAVDDDLDLSLTGGGGGGLGLDNAYVDAMLLGSWAGDGEMEDGMEECLPSDSTVTTRSGTEASGMGNNRWMAQQLLDMLSVEEMTSVSAGNNQNTGGSARRSDAPNNNAS